MGDTLFIVKAKEYQVKDGDSIKSLADANGMTWQELARFNWGTDKPDKINKFLRARVGCSKLTADGKNYVFSDKDNPGIIYIPEQFPEKKFPVNQPQTINLKRPKIFATIYIQTTDLFGNKNGNQTLVLKPENGGADVTVTTDADGYVKKEKVLFGSYKVFSGGKPAWVVLREDHLIEAKIHTDNAMGSITSIVVLSNSEKELKLFQKRKKLKKIYRNVADNASEEVQETDGSYSYVECTDNFALAAGWENGRINVDALINKVLKKYIEYKAPETKEKKYYILVWEREINMLTLFDKDGNQESVFNLKMRSSAPVGLYAIFEKNGYPIFTDFENNRFVISNLDDLDHITPLGNAIADSDFESYVSAINKHKGEIQLVYYLCTAKQLRFIALHGGTGRLLDYCEDESTNKKIHDINKAMCEHVKDIYEGYVEGYVKDISKMTEEDEIREKGPPLSLYMYPAPAGATGPQVRELFDSNYSGAEFKVWKAICLQLDVIYKQLPEGAMFLSLKIDMDKVVESEYGAAKAPMGFEVTYNFFFDNNGNLVPTEAEVETKGSIEIGTEGEEGHGHGGGHGGKEMGVAVEAARNVKTGDMTYKGRVKYGMGEVELTTRGGVKAEFEVFPEIGGVVTESNAVKAEFGLGGYAHIGKYGKIYGMVNFKGISESTLLAYFSHAPGFFERRTAEKIIYLLWNDLWRSEQARLKELGWDQEKWDGAEEEYPESTKKDFEELSATEKIAAVHLGIITGEWKEFWEKRKETLEKRA